MSTMLKDKNSVYNVYMRMLQDPNFKALMTLGVHQNFTSATQLYDKYMSLLMGEMALRLNKPLPKEKMSIYYSRIQEDISEFLGQGQKTEL